MRFVRQSLTGIFLFAVTLSVLAAAGINVRNALEDRRNAEPWGAPARERVIAVNTVTLNPTSLNPELTVFGEVQSRRTLDLRAATGGTVEMVADAFVDGGTVSEGTLLIQIDPVEAIAARDRSRADLQDAEAEVRDAQRGLILARDDLAAAQEQAALRDQALIRARDLEARGVGTAAAVEAAELSASSARGTVVTRRQALANAEARIDQAQTRLTRARITLAEAERAVDNTRIYAGFDGTLSGISAVQGGRVSANEVIGQLIDPDRLEVQFRVSTAQYAQLLDDTGALLRAPITASLDVQGADLSATGVIARESASVGQGQSGRLLFADLDMAPGLRPGDFVTVRVQQPALQNVVLVPSTAVAPDGTVLVLGQEDRLFLAEVTLLRRQGDDVIIRADDLVGERIVAERSPLLGAGIKVRAIQPAASIPQEAAAPATITLDDARRARLIAYVTEHTMPEAEKTRLISQLEQDEVSAETVTRLERGMDS